MIRLRVVLIAVIVTATASHLVFLSRLSLFDLFFPVFLDFRQYGPIFEHLDKFLTVTTALVECLYAILCLDRFVAGFIKLFS